MNVDRKEHEEFVSKFGVILRIKIDYFKIISYFSFQMSSTFNTDSLYKHQNMDSNPKVNPSKKLVVKDFALVSQTNPKLKSSKIRILKFIWKM